MAATFGGGEGRGGGFPPREVKKKTPRVLRGLKKKLTTVIDLSCLFGPGRFVAKQQM